MLSKNNVIKTLYFISCAFAVLLVCTRSSFLYPYNNWDDANSYFTMGKGMMNGLVIYRDLYDQKGPFLYLVYGIAYLISNRSFAGVFVIEILFAGFFAAEMFMILKLYCSEKVSLLSVPVLLAIVYSSRCLYWGGSAEELCLPLFGYSLYSFLKFSGNTKQSIPPLRVLFINGLAAGVVMNVKYNMLGFYIGLFFAFLLIYVLHRDYRTFFKGIMIIASGMFLATLPWLIYFGANGSLGSWYECYVYNNVHIYSNFEDRIAVSERIYKLAKKALDIVLKNNPASLFAICGGLYTLLAPRKTFVEKIGISFSVFFLFLGIYIGGGTLDYYAIPFMVYVVLGFVVIGVICGYICKKLFSSFTVSRYFFAGVSILFICLSAFTAYMRTPNREFMAQDKDNYFLTKAAAHITDENASLANINYLDCGLYTATGIVPNIRYFQTNGIAVEEMFEEQARYIREGVTDYIIICDNYPDSIYDHYELLDQWEVDQSEYHFNLFLFKKIM
ncbi:hypothetical protein [Butyrivibrio sp. INlla21]|uniref:hypothetical protein n=1 Tax=Butyrivibrio sp. INlla21 TaxID=1520811 RepID=UPI0008E19598|nr:hypothetical protein [Butyrivibrio sp. INlla21]SFU98379.1 hypothetical protein SAMN02910342_02740 [Butyrivibrio sp. INlla21]